MLLAIAQGQVNTVKCVSMYSLTLNSMSFTNEGAKTVIFVSDTAIIIIKYSLLLGGF